MTETPLASASQPEIVVPLQIVVPPEIFDIAAESIGKFFEPISKVDRITNARDFLDLSQSFKRAEIIKRYTPLESAELLEAGSGFGTNLAVWLRHFNVDAYGVEPGGEGFNPGYRASRKLLIANGMDPDRVINSGGEELPFPDESFDILIVALQGHYPIYLTVRKGPAKPAAR